MFRIKKIFIEKEESTPISKEEYTIPKGIIFWREEINQIKYKLPPS